MVLFSIVTHNRLLYLKNLMESIFEFVDLTNVKILIVDSSSEKGYDEYLSSLSNNEKIYIKRYNPGDPGALHRDINYSVTYARKRKIPYISLMQDDFQFVWRDVDYVNRIERSFRDEKMSHVVQLMTQFNFKRRRLKVKPFNTEWMLLKKWPSDIGVTRMSLFNKIGKFPSSVTTHGGTSGEKWLSKKCGLKYYRAVSTTPSIVQIKAVVIRAGHRYGKYGPPLSGKYYVKPLTLDQINKMKVIANNKQCAYGEDFIELDKSLKKWWI